MTGSGTQSDPFVPITLTEFIEAVGTSGAYVALDRDIDAAEDPNYGGELTAPIYINATSVNGNRYEVCGVTVRAANLIWFQGSNVDIYDIFLYDWAHKRTSDSSCTILGHNFSRNKLHDCLLSIKVDCGGHSGEIVSQAAFYTCALSILMIDAASGIQINTTVFDTTTLLVDGMDLRNSQSFYGTPFTRSALILKNAIMISGGAFIYDCGGTGAYIAFLDGLDGTINMSNFLGQYCLAVAPQGQQMTLTTAIQQATFDQMKDKDWLASVGFLP